MKSRLPAKTLWLSLIVLMVVASACGGAAATGPPEINYGRDICIECNMIISEARFASAYRLPDGTERIFDDVGGMVLHGRETGELNEATAWVHDFETEEWVEAATAFFVPTTGVTSPMGHGILAFAEQVRADDFADDVAGEVIDWTTVMALPVVDGLVGHHHGRDDGMDEDMEHDNTMEDGDES